MATKRKDVPRIRKMQRRRVKKKKLEAKGVDLKDLYFEGTYIGPIKSK